MSHRLKSDGRSAASLLLDPHRDCALCPRLKSFRDDWRRDEPDWFNAPVPIFGSLKSSFAIVGLAPGLRGANRTGRPFTGDFAGQLLYETLIDAGFARGIYRESPDDGLQLVESCIVNAVRCVPPQNKPTPLEIRTCVGAYLAPTLAAMPNLAIILALGRIAHDGVLRAFGRPLSSSPFSHGKCAEIVTPEGRSIALFDSYHCSRYNTNTGVLTRDMFRDVVARIRTKMQAAA